MYMSMDEIETCISTIFNKPAQAIADGIVKAVYDMREYWPLTVRQVYYQLVAALLISNNINNYRKVSRLGVKLREHELIPWRAFEDRNRRTTAKRGESNVADFIGGEIRGFLLPEYYGRCYVQEQDVYIEVSLEKDALSSILERVTYSFCTRLNIVRGQVSATQTEQIATRLDRAIMRGQNPVILHMGDLDPSGVAIPRALENNLWERHGIQCQVEPICLTPDQVNQYNLPTSIEAIKERDPNLNRWLEKYGKEQSPVEIDALKPDILQSILKNELMDWYDMADFKRQKEIELQERELLQQMRCDVEDFLWAEYPEYMDEAG